MSNDEKAYNEAIIQLCAIRYKQKNDVMYYAIQDIQKYVENLKKEINNNGRTETRTSSL